MALPPQSQKILGLDVLSITGDCSATSVGAVELKSSGGQGPFTLQIISPYVGTAQLANNVGPFYFTSLSAGSYTVRITDSSNPNNQIATENFYISSGISIDTFATNASCYGNNGTIQVTCTPTLNNNFTYYLYDSFDTLLNVITTNQNPYTFSGLTSGAYYIIVDDNAGCSDTSRLMVVGNNITNLNIVPQVISSNPCSVKPDGEIFITVNNAKPPITVEWSVNVGTVLNPYHITNLIAGTYSVTVTDSLGCPVTQDIVVPQSNTLGIVSYNVTQPTCFQNDGQVNVFLSGCTPPYTYSTSNGDIFLGGTATTFTNLAGGAFSFTATCGSCKVSQVFNLVTPNSFGVISSTATYRDCTNSGGTISLIVNGRQTLSATCDNGQGTIYTLTNIQAGSPVVFNNLPPGEYSVSITDTLGTCVYTQTFTLINQLGFEVNASSESTTCGGSNGTATVNTYTFVGGQIFTIELSNGTTATNVVGSYQFTGLSQGNYTYTVTNNSGCSITDSFTVGNSNNLDFILTKGICRNGGSLSAIVNNGTPPYNFIWEGDVSGQTGLSIGGLSNGTYSLTVTDSEGCTLTRSETINCETRNSESYQYTFGGGEFQCNGNSQVGFSQMLNQGYIELTEGLAGCQFSSATFYIDFDFSGISDSVEFYTSYSLNDIPTNYDYAQEVQTYLNGLGIFGSIVIDYETGRIIINTQCDNPINDENLSIAVRIEYEIECNDQVTPTPTPTSTPTPTTAPIVFPTLTPTVTATATPQPTLTQTPTKTLTSTPTPTITQTLTATNPIPCGIVVDKNFMSFGPCNPSTNKYSVSGTNAVIITGPPPLTGTLIIANSCDPTQTVTFSAPFISPYSFVFTGLTSNGGACSIIASFSDNPTCNGSTSYMAPSSCALTPTATKTLTPTPTPTRTLTPTSTSATCVCYTMTSQYSVLKVMQYYNCSGGLSSINVPGNGTSTPFCATGFPSADPKISYNIVGGCIGGVCVLS